MNAENRSIRAQSLVKGSEIVLDHPFTVRLPLPTRMEDIGAFRERHLIDAAFDFPGWFLFWEATGSGNPVLDISILQYCRTINTAADAVADFQDMEAEDEISSNRVLSYSNGHVIHIVPGPEEIGGGGVIYVLSATGKGALKFVQSFCTSWEVEGIRSEG